MHVSKTCQNCARSKVRCLRNDTQSSCDRCHRLGKECTYRQAGRRFDGFRKDKQIEALEAKVNELMAFRPMAASAPDLSRQGDVVDQKILSIETAEYFWDVFQTRMAPHFPFVVIPPHIRAHKLRQEKPFLFLAVLASSTYENLPLQRRLGREMKEQIANRMVLNGEVSFELLQGLLVYLVWSHFHKKPHRYTQFLQLAIGLVIELRLDRPQHTANPKTALQWKTKSTSGDQTYTRRSWGSDEQRAVAGCYYLSSTNAVLVQKPSTFPNISQYLEDCCESLREANEHPNDRYICHILRLQLLTEKVDRVVVCHGMSSCAPSPVTDLYFTSLQEDLETFRRQLPFDLHDYPLLAMQFHVAELCLCQIEIKDTPENPDRSTVSGASTNQRKERLFCGLRASESLFNMYLSYPTNYGLGFNNIQWIQMGFSLLVTCRMVLATTKAASQASSSQRNHWTETVLQLRDRMESLSAARTDKDSESDVFCNFSQRVSRVMSWLGKNPQAQNHPADEAIGRSEIAHTGDSTTGETIPGNARPEPFVDPASFGLAFEMGSDIDLSQDEYFTAALDQMMGNWF